MLAPAKVMTAFGFNLESMTSGWLFLRFEIGLIDSWSPNRLFCVLMLVCICGGYWLYTSREVPKSPALLIVLVLRVMPPELLPPISASCASRWFLRRRQRKNIKPPTTARRTATPPTTPPAIAPTFGPSSLLSVLTGDEDELGPADGERYTVRVTTLPFSVLSWSDIGDCDGVDTGLEVGLLLVLDVGCAEVGPGAVPEGRPFWMYMNFPSSILPQSSCP